MKTLYESFEKLYRQSKADEVNAPQKIKPLIQESISLLKKSMETMSIEQAEFLVEDNL